MVVDKTKMGLTFKHPRVSRDTQEAALRAAGASWIVHVGQSPPTWKDPIKQLQPGDTVYVYSCPMLPAPRDQLGPQSAQWTCAVKSIHERGAKLYEVATGRKSNIPAQWKEMNRATHAAFRKGGKVLSRGIMPQGRPRKTWPSAEVRQAAMKLWKSKNIASDKAAIREAIETWPGVTESMMRALGRSGRN